MPLESLVDRPGLRLALSPILLPLSGLYAFGLSVDRFLGGLRRRSLPVPTISIGNLTVGGTGKTPVLLHLVSELRSLGRKPFILTRGYAGVGRSVPAGIVRSSSDAAGFSDEVRLMADVLPGVPVGAGANRLASAEKILSAGNANVAVLDDGFQHWRLARALDVVCIDVTDPWGGGFLIPFGRLREPRTALSRAGLVVITRCERASAERVAEIEADARRFAPGAAVVRARFSLTLLTADRRSAPTPPRAVAMSAIGNPGAFEANLSSLGIEPIPVRYEDHHAYSEEEFRIIATRARTARVPIITTAKDWVKIRDFPSAASEPVLIASQSLSFDGTGGDDWRARIEKALSLP